MSEEMREFAIKEAGDAGDAVAAELMRRATGFDIEATSVDKYDRIAMFFEFSGATYRLAWNKDDRFDDPSLVYEVFLRLIYDVEDSVPVRKRAEEDDGPMAFVWGSEEEMDDDEDDDDIGSGFRI